MLGSITVLGISPTPETAYVVCHWLESRIFSQSRIPLVTTTLMQHEDTFYLVAVNNGQVDKDTRVDLLPGVVPLQRCLVHDLTTDTGKQIDVSHNSQVTARPGQRRHQSRHHTSFISRLSADKLQQGVNRLSPEEITTTQVHSLCWKTQLQKISS